MSALITDEIEIDTNAECSKKYKMVFNTLSLNLNKTGFPLTT